MKKRMISGAAALTLTLASFAPAWAEPITVRLAQQFGIGYMPLTLVQQQGLLEKHAQAAGLDLKAEWLRFSGGSGMNEALLSGNLDIAAGGTTPMLTIWARTQNNLRIKGVAALSSMPLHMMTTKPELKTLADFTAADKIALPAVKTSIQAITLQMAAEKYLGEGKHASLDSFTVSMGHPDGQLALLGGQSEINTHFTSPPFQNLEAKDPRTHKVIDSYDVLGGSHSFTAIWAKADFIEGNPKVADALLAAIDESIAFIEANPQEAAAIWSQAEGTNLTQEEIVALITDPQVKFTTTPERLLPYVNYMARAGLIKQDTNDWRDLFFDTVSHLEGS